MIQKDYLVESPLTAARAVADIEKTLRETPHRDALLTIYETGFPRSMIKTLLSLLKGCEIYGLKTVGISIFAIVDSPFEGQGVRLNLLVSEKAEFEIADIPFLPGEEDGAIERMRARLAAHPDAKAVLILSGNTGIDMDMFLSKSAGGFQDIVFFGTSTTNAGPPLQHSMEDLLAFDSTSISSRENFVIGNEIFTDGVVAVIFSGEELFVQSNYVLGWHAIGREMEIAAGRRADTHEAYISTIDGMKATEIFREYLGVKPDKYFSTNICEFPLMVNKNGVDICLIPYRFGEEGEIYFCSSVKNGDRVTFSYASSSEVLISAAQSFEEMEKFSPDALFLVMCGNRLNFLHEDAHIEWDKYRALVQNYALIHGFCELYFRNGSGGVLNSAHVAIGFSEGVKERKSHRYEYLPDYLRCSHKGVIPLSDRMSFFMTKMTSELLEMAKKAEASNQAKSAFLSSMSHEIRTPINAVLGMDEMILRESNEDNVIGYANDIMSAGHSLLGIVNDVLDFSKIEAGKLSIIPVEYEFSSVINDLYTVIRKRALDKGLELKLDIDPSIPSVLYGDEIRLKQVVTNILTNAVKYTEEGSVTLTVKRVSREKEAFSDGSECHGNACFARPVYLFVEVKDTGIGIKEEDMKKLFNPFERMDENRNRTIEGTGLGLNITESLLNLMESELSVESVYGEGSAFSFTIKQGISRDEPVGDIKSRLERSREKKKYAARFTAPFASILVVDDTRMNLDVIKNLLKKTRMSIDTAESGQEALSCVREKEYDIIFLDHRMPNMDGVECLKRMKEMEDNKSADAPVISLTANAISGAREFYLTSGFSDYLTKPIDPAKLDDILIRYLPKEKVRFSKSGDGDGKKTSALYSRGEKPRIIMIDDEPLMHEAAKNILSGSFSFEAFSDGKSGAEGAAKDHTDLILLDVKMPGEDGFETMKRLKADDRTSAIPVIFLTGDENRETEIEGLKAGAWDFVRKPFSPEVLKQRVEHTIELSRLQADLQNEVSIKTLKIEHLTEEIMLSLSKAVDAKDHYTNGHSERVAGYSVMLAKKMGMDENAQREIYSMGLLHDVGKIGVSEAILNKPARLTDEEFSEIKTHTVKGYEILKTITELPSLATGARWHHERYDGTGYPDGKQGEDIPIAARIICVADSYDAMSSTRSYSKPREQEKVRAEIVRCSGTQFDPIVAEKMVELIDEDPDYLMNELSYKDSAAAKHVEALLKQKPTAPEEGPGEDESEKDMALPGWLRDSSSIDASAGVSNCGSVSGYLSVLSNFYSALPASADEIEKYLSEGDIKNYTVKVHALKSSARIIGAAELSKRAAALEKAGDEGNIELIKADTPKLLTLYRSYQEVLSPLNGDDEDLPDIPENMLSDAYQSLFEFADGMDLSLSRMVLDSVKEYRLLPDDKKRFDDIRAALSRLDWELIRKIIKER